MMNELEENEALGKAKIEELEVQNEKLILEVNLLKEENGTFQRKEIEDLAKLSEEFEEEYARKTRKLLMEVERKEKAMEETKEALGRKDEALKVAKVKECDYIVNLDTVEKEVKALQMRKHHGPHSHLPRGSFLNHPPTCYFSLQNGHLKAHCLKFHKYKKMRESRNKKNTPRVRKIWVRKDLVNQVRPKGKQKGKSTQFVWVAKKNQFPNLVKSPLVDVTHSTST
ncbi:hypothetical protein LWI28_024212 [Acer negundo]|uniref:Uncharacterized protein n=1 Tax=Acer negundo TaxID=4023 RepID=A0AAD5IXB8_ACENE|nr:hypothetical protein LWI28_024212 [Acer negundo]